MCSYLLRISGCWWENLRVGYCYKEVMFSRGRPCAFLVIKSTFTFLLDIRDVRPLTEGRTAISAAVLEESCAVLCVFCFTDACSRYVKRVNICRNSAVTLSQLTNPTQARCLLKNPRYAGSAGLQHGGTFAADKRWGSSPAYGATEQQYRPHLLCPRVRQREVSSHYLFYFLFVVQPRALKSRLQKLQLRAAELVVQWHLIRKKWHKIVRKGFDFQVTGTSCNEASIDSS